MCREGLSRDHLGETQLKICVLGDCGHRRLEGAVEVLQSTSKSAGIGAFPPHAALCVRFLLDSWLLTRISCRLDTQNYQGAEKEPLEIPVRPFLLPDNCVAGPVLQSNPRQEITPTTEDTSKNHSNVHPMVPM